MDGWMDALRPVECGKLVIRSAATFYGSNIQASFGVTAIDKANMAKVEFTK